MTDVLAVGVMSGTSLDGVSTALVKLRGDASGASPRPSLRVPGRLDPGAPVTAFVARRLPAVEEGDPI